MTAPLIAARHVSRRYRRGPEVVHALEGVTVALEAGSWSCGTDGWRDSG